MTVQYETSVYEYKRFLVNTYFVNYFKCKTKKPFLCLKIIDRFVAMLRAPCHHKRYFFVFQLLAPHLKEYLVPGATQYNIIKHLLKQKLLIDLFTCL